MMDTDWWDLVPDLHRTHRIPEPLLALDGRVSIILFSFKPTILFRSLSHREHATRLCGSAHRNFFEIFEE